MKSLAVLALATLLYANSASALIVVVQSCQTENGSLKVTIMNNQGIGFDRSTHLVATVSDKDGNMIVSYPVNSPSPVQSMSFGRSPYTDSLTQGHDFSLAFPSTNFGHTSLLVQLPNAALFRSDTVVCNQIK